MLYTYKLLIRNDIGKEKEFFLSEESENKVIKRACSSYGVTRDAVRIAAIYKNHEHDDGYDLVESRIEQSRKDDKLVKKVDEIYSKLTRRSEPYKSEYADKYGFKFENISHKDDIYAYVEKYHKVKVYWDITERRGEHQLYVMFK